MVAAPRGTRAFLSIRSFSLWSDPHKRAGGHAKNVQEAPSAPTVSAKTRGRSRKQTAPGRFASTK